MEINVVDYTIHDKLFGFKFEVKSEFKDLSSYIWCSPSISLIITYRANLEYFPGIVSFWIRQWNSLLFVPGLVALKLVALRTPTHARDKHNHMNCDNKGRVIKLTRCQEFCPTICLLKFKILQTRNSWHPRAEFLPETVGIEQPSWTASNQYITGPSVVPKNCFIAQLLSTIPSCLTCSRKRL